MGRSEDWHPLSHSQEALWFLWKLAPQSWAYNTVLPARICGALDVAALRRSLLGLYERHPGLRTEFWEKDGEVRQRPLAEHRLDLEEVEAPGWSEERLERALYKRARRPFDLEKSATMRLTLFARGSHEHVLILVGHHITSDLWSFIVLMDELKGLYQAEQSGGKWNPPESAISFQDHVWEQREELAGERGERLFRFWREELAGELPVLDLPTDRSRPPIQSFRGGTVLRRLPAELTNRWKGLASSSGSTLFMALLAAYQVLLHRYTGQEELLVGSPTSGRQRSEVADLVGDFVNMVTLRADLSGRPGFGAVLERARNKVIQALHHQDYPFSLLVDRLQPARDLSRSPIFQTSFVLQKFHRFEELSGVMLPGDDEPPIPFGDLQLEPIWLAQQDGQFDVHLETKEDHRGRLMCAFKYAADLFEAVTIERLSGHFEVLLEEILAHPDRSLGELRLLSVEESREVIVSGQGPLFEPPRAVSVAELFEAQIERFTSKMAVRCGEHPLTYAELGERCHRLARRLVTLGVGRDVLVGLHLPRGLDFVAVLLSISKAGGAFLPLDPRHPVSRIAGILESSGAPLILTSRASAEELAQALAAHPKPPRILTMEDLERTSPSRRLPRVSGGDLAYVMYTSGSTGRPKGVQVEHRGMVNHVLGKLADLEMECTDVLAQNGPQSFDIIVWQCLAPLVLGGRIEIFPDEIAEDPAELVAQVEKSGVTVLQVVPSMLLAILEEIKPNERPALADLRWMVPTGEALPTELCRRWLGLYPDKPVLNTYGSTECSDDQCHYPLHRLAPADEAVAVVSIGTPIRNMTASVYDGNLAPVPVGVVGELYIGGVGVGRGYRRDPRKTAAAFLPDPAGREPGARLYRTRDLARRRADGNLDFLGRVDHMIKLRGFRIEPKEIEAVLVRHEAICEAAVVARVHPSGERRLVGYAVPAGQGPEIRTALENLRPFLAEHLPQYMVPSTLSFLSSLPLSANGKLDQRRLPEPAWKSAALEELILPRTPAEEVMAEIWAEVLELEQVGVTEDFFVIGGDSIRSIRIVSRAKNAGWNLRPSDLFQHHTIEALAALAESEERALPDREPPESETNFPDLSEEHLALAFAQVEFEGN